MKIKQLINALLICVLLSFSNAVAATSTQQLVDRAKDLREKGRYDDAIVLLLKAMEQKPNSREIIWHCANSYDKIGFNSEAMRYYEQIANLTNEAISYANLGGFYAQLGYLDKSLAAINKSLEIDPDLLNAYANRSIIYSYYYRIDESYADLEYFTNNTSQYKADILFNMAILFHGAKDYEKSYGYLLKYFSRDDSQPHNLLFLEEVEMLRNKSYKPSIANLNKALEAYTVKIKHNWYDYYSIFKRGECYRLLGEKELARKDYLQSLKLINEVVDDLPDNFRSHRLRGIFYRRLGEKQKAINDFEYVLSVNPAEQSVRDELEEVRNEK